MPPMAAAPPAAEAEAAVAGLHSLPREVLLSVVQLLDENRAENPMLPLRAVSRTFRDAVDASICSFSIRAVPAYPDEPGDSVMDVDRCLREVLPRWCNLTRLGMHFSWAAPYLQFALETLARSCPALQQLHLDAEEPKGAPPSPENQEAARGGRERGRERGREGEVETRVCIGVLSVLSALEDLGVQRFGMYPLWWEGIGRLGALKALRMEQAGVPGLEAMPRLKRLMVTECGDSGPWRSAPHVFKLALQPELVSLHLEALRVPLLAIPRGMQALALHSVTLLTPLASPELPRLLSLDLVDVAPPLDLSLLSSSPHLTSLRVATGPGSFLRIKLAPPPLSHLSALHSLTLIGLEPQERPLDLPPLPSLQLLDIQKCRFPDLLNLEALPGLGALTLAHCCNLRRLPVLSALSSLSSLRLSGFLGHHGIPQVSSLSTLQELELVGLVEQQLPPLTPSMRGLERLVVAESPCITDLPPALGDLPSLRCLILRDLQRVQRLPELRGLHSLTLLSIEDCPDLDHVSFDGLSALLYLVLKELPLPSLPSVGALSSLQSLSVSSLPNLAEFTPHAHALQGLTSLEVAHCPSLRVLGIGPAPVLETLECSDCVGLEEIQGLESLPSATRVITEGCPNLTQPAAVEAQMEG